MKSRIGDKQRLLHILEAIDIIESFVKDVSYDDYKADLKLRLALVKLVENIGEASANFSEETKKQYSYIDWPAIKGMRNIIIHEYFDISYELVWNTIQHEIPILKTQLQQISL